MMILKAKEVIERLVKAVCYASTRDSCQDGPPRAVLEPNPRPLFNLDSSE